MKTSPSVRCLKKYYISLVKPNEINMSLSDIIGMENEKNDIETAITFFNSLRLNTPTLQIKPYTRYLLTGRIGSGKSTLVLALAKTTNVPVIVLYASTFVAFPKKIIQILNKIFNIANSFKSGCIIHFKDFDSIDSLPDDKCNLFLNHFLLKISSIKNTVIFLSSSIINYELSAETPLSNIFNKVISVQPPALKAREELFKFYLKDYSSMLQDISYERLARATFGMFPIDILWIIQETFVSTQNKNLKKVSMDNFNETILKAEVGQSNLKLSEKERESTAYHESGHVIAAYYSNPNYVLNRVEITPRQSSLGLTKEEITEEKFSAFKHELYYQIIYLLGGMAAEKVTYGETTTGVVSDLAIVSTLVSLMFKSLGMNEELGPIIFEESIGFSSTELVNQLEYQMQKYIKESYDTTVSIIIQHREQLEALAKALLEKEVLQENEVKNILDSVSSNRQDTRN